LHGAVAVVLACGIGAGIAGFAREMQSDRRGVPSAVFPPEMPRFRQAVFAALSPGAEIVFVDAGNEPWIQVLVERALFPHPVWIVRGSRRDLRALIRQREAPARPRFVIVAGHPPVDPGLLHSRSLPRLSGFSGAFLFGELEP
jgi:hypothetical protein